MSADAWDGYPSERRALMSFVKDQGIKNLLVVTGDIHAHFAGLIFDDYDKETDRVVVAAELCTAGIASNSLFSFYEAASKPLAAQFPELRKIVTFDGSASGGAKFVENLNMTILHGRASAKVVADGGTIEQALAARVTTGDHVKYADTNSQGYGLLSINGERAVGTLITVNRPTANPTQAAGIKRAARFTIPKDNPAGMSPPEIMGEKPFPVT